MNSDERAPSQLPIAAAVISHRVEDFATWKRVFDGNVERRRQAGIIAAHINRDAVNPNQVSIYLAGTDRDRLASFLSDIDLMKKMHSAGVSEAPLIIEMTPVEDVTVKDRPLPGLIIRHEVRDFPAWKSGFDAHAPARAQAGIIGHAVNRSARHPNLVVVYLQAESMQTLRDFAAAIDSKQVMQRAGVIGAPDLTFVDGSDWQR